MENNIENIRGEAKVYTNQTSIFIVDYMKMPKTSVINASFLSLRRCLQVYSWPRYAKISQTEPGFLRNVYL